MLKIKLKCLLFTNTVQVLRKILCENNFRKVDYNKNCVFLIIINELKINEKFV